MKSTDIIEPTAISQPIANTGTRNTISQSATGTGYASVAEGFPDVTMIAPADGGLPPRGEDCNGLFYLSTDQKAYLQNGGYITFNEEVSELIGGYPAGAILDYYNSDTNVWAKVISLIDDNTNNFIETPTLIDGTNWKYADIATTSWGSITGNIENQTDLQEVLNNLKNYIYNIGDPIITLSGTLNDNEIWLEGDEVSKTDYAALYEIYGDTYGTPEDEDNFVLPDFRGRAIWGNDSFGYIDEGLPTHTHTRGTMEIAGTFTATGDTSSGGSNTLISSIASADSGARAQKTSDSTRFFARTYTFKASQTWSGSTSEPSDSIYGNSDTVQPPAICVRVKTRYS